MLQGVLLTKNVGNYIIIIGGNGRTIAEIIYKKAYNKQRGVNMARETYINERQNATTAVLFIHGFLSSPEYFERFTDYVPKNVSVFNILLDGHASTVEAFSKTSMDKWKKQMEKVADEICSKYEKVYIVAHSMGTFFAMDAAIKHHDRIKGIILLQSALKIHIKPIAVINLLKAFFGVYSHDETSEAYDVIHGIDLNFRLWEYAGWISRYRELKKESVIKRTAIKNVEIPCTIFMAINDELVSYESVKFIPQKENFILYTLHESAHFIYEKEEENFIGETIFKMIDA